jgi:hypothetical protein
MTEGGYPEAVARVFALPAHDGKPFPLAQLHLKRELAEKYARLLPTTSGEQQRRIRGEQEIIVRYEPKRALATLPRLLGRQADRHRLLKLLDAVLYQGKPGATGPDAATDHHARTHPRHSAGGQFARPSLSLRGAPLPKAYKTPKRTRKGKHYGNSQQRHL